MKTNTSQTNKNELDKIINTIEAELDMGTKLPPFGTIVKTKNVTEQLKNLRKAAHFAIEESQLIVANRERFLEEASHEAEELVRRRQMELSKQPVLQEAEEIAKKMLLQAKKESDRLMKEAAAFEEQVRERSLKYADTIYIDLENRLNDKSMNVAKNRESLKAMLSESARPRNEKTLNEVQQSPQAEQEVVFEQRKTS